MSNQMPLPFEVNIPVLLEGIPHPAMILDEAYRIITMNRLMEAMTGYGADRVNGIHGELIIRSNTGNNRGQLYNKVMQTGVAVTVTGDIINSYRRKIAIQYSISVLDDTSGRHRGLLVIAEDLSARQADQKSGLGNYSSIELIGHSPKMQKVFDMMLLLAQTDASVMITGETGTGKDKIAEIIHQRSSRARFPFIKINCGALPPGLLESELFGHVKGSFTGATRNKPGMFSLADKGTLFLTEIGDMPVPLQVKLLSVLDDREFMPVGGENKISVDVRIIAATHRPLREQVRKNRFREDLFYRLNVLQIHLPPLRERDGDVRYLLDYFLQKFTKALNKTIVGFAPSAMQTLLNFQYPGNIRELSNIVEYAVNICAKKKITTEHLPPYIFDQQIKDQDSLPGLEVDKAVESKNSGNQEKFDTSAPQPESWFEIERQLIVDMLKEQRGNRTKAAKRLGWGRMTLWRKMKKYGLQE
jgi:PAS domain S-box-containing protein